MNTPAFDLMKRYGTQNLYVEKVAGEVPSLLDRLAMGLLNYKLTSSGQSEDERQHLEEELRRQAILELEQAQMAQALQNLRYTQVPPVVHHPQGPIEPWMLELTPPPLTEGMLRLASVAVEAGADLAKEAGIGGVPVAANLFERGKKALTGGFGLKTNLGMLGATALAGTAVTKGLQAGERFARAEAPPAVYGMGNPGRNVGYQIPSGVNQYGYPQVGTPLV